MNDEQFTKLFKYVEDFRTEVNQKLDQKASQATLEHLITTINGFVKRLEDNEIEQSARDLQVDRLLDWARNVSKKTGIPFKNL
jgi:FKBP-type peptidyl-prolyl cis-trans isomerase (trigger factor)